MPPQDFVVVLELDLAVQFLQAVARQLGGPIARPEAGVEVAKVAQHLAEYRNRFVAAAQRQVIIAQPSDVPPEAKAG